MRWSTAVHDRHSGGRSTIRGLLATGQDVYLVDWGYPDQADRALTLDDYLNGYSTAAWTTSARRTGSTA